MRKTHYAPTRSKRELDENGGGEGDAGAAGVEDVCPGELWQCSRCNISYPSKRQLVAHRRAQHQEDEQKEKLYQCDQVVLQLAC